MLETIIGVTILVVAVLGAKVIFARTGGSSSQPKTGGGSGCIPEGTPSGTGDGSVTPPTGPVAE